MTTIPVSAGSAGTGIQPPKTQAAPALDSDFEAFLKMLVAQARFQDPMEPMDAGQYATQLAQFSMVEQQVRSNDLLSGLADTLSGANLSALAGWIGADARAAMPVHFSGSPVDVMPDIAEGADAATLVVTDATGPAPAPAGAGRAGAVGGGRP